MFKSVKTKIINGWLNYLYVAGLVTTEEYAELQKLVKYADCTVSKKHKHLLQ